MFEGGEKVEESQAVEALEGNNSGGECKNGPVGKRRAKKGL